MIIKAYDSMFNTEKIIKIGVGCEIIKDNNINGILVINQHQKTFGLEIYPNKKQFEDVFTSLSEMFIDSDTKIFTMPKPINEHKPTNSS